MVFLYIAYKLTMAGERQFAVNRVAIYAMYAVSLLLPAVYTVVKTMQIVESQIADTNIEIMPLGAMTILAAEVETPSWPRVMLWIYLIGVVLASVRLMVSIMRIVGLARSRENHRLDNGYILVLTDDRHFSPFSFMRYIVISKEDYSRSKDEILTHEITHLRKLHWIDQISANIIAIFMWYNPVAWLMIEELRTVHEYQADAAVIDSGADLKKYQYLLIEKAVGKRFPSPANSLNHSKLKKRVTMMYKSKPSKMRRMAAITVIPAALVALAITDIPAVAEVISETGSAKLRTVSDDKIINFSSDSQVSVDEKSADETKKVVSVEPKKENAESDEQRKVLSASTSRMLDEIKVVSYSSETHSANQDDSKSESNPVFYINGKEVPLDVIDALDTGKIKSITVDKSEGEQIWIELIKSVEQDESKNLMQICDMPDQLPEFPGGMDNMMHWLAMNIRYPKEAMEKDIQGRVSVHFIVTQEGKVTDASIMQGVDASLDEEALRVVNAMPVWTPGKYQGKAVNCGFSLPINFRLQRNPVPDKSASSKKE